MKTLRLLTLAGLAIIAGAWLWTSGHDEASTTSVAADVAPAAAADPIASDDAASLVAAPPSLRVPMPSPDLPLRDAASSLQWRADAGDSLAACRLGVALLRCQSLEVPIPDYDDILAQQEKAHEAEGEFDEANQIALTRIRRAQVRQDCTGVPEALVAKAGHYVRQAALAGEPEAMVRYAAGETLTTADPNFGFITSPAFDAWRREARPVLDRALDAGVPEAVLLLAEAHATGWVVLSMLLPRDPVDASASLALAHRLFGADPALARLNAPTTLDPEQTARADALAADWHENRFNGRRLDLAESTAALRPVHGFPLPADASERWPAAGTATPCATPAAAVP